MANIILSEGSERLNSLYGKVQAPIASFIETQAEAYEKESIGMKIFQNRKSTHWAESYASLTAVDTFAPVGENGAYPTGGAEEGYLKTIRNTTWKGSFAISREMMDDAQAINLKKKPAGFVNDYYRKRERFLAQLLGVALQGGTGFKLGVESYDTTSADGVSMFNKAHKMKVKNGTQSNAFTDAFSAAALGKAQTAMQNFRGDTGEILALAPDTIIIPNLPDLKEEVFGVIGAHNDPDTAAGNKYNYQFGNWTVLVWPYLNEFITAGSAPWILMDSRYNELGDGAIYQERVPLEVRSELADNDANVWKGYARYGGGFADFRAFAAGGIASGSAL